MANKKDKVEIIRPINAIESLGLFNERVVALVGIVEIALKNELISPVISKEVFSQLNSVKEFYKDNA